MVKTQSPARIELSPNLRVWADAVPDAFDERDLPYVPSLQPLPDVLDQRRDATVLTQQGFSCTGHAVAAMINTVYAGVRPLDATDPPVLVSPYMLYSLGRRYDEFAGDADVGSSLRGVLKGWFRHGVALQAEWPELETDPDLENAAFRARCDEHPLGAYFRVNVQRLDDLQSAIRELHAIAVSAAVHSGWQRPLPMQRDGMTKPIWVIRKRRGDEMLGGHAFVLVGYNRVGFLVQNSWGTEWGKDGFATLPYEDWLEHAYDAWVARPGVPATPLFRPRTAVTRTTGGGMAATPGPDVRALVPYVVNLGAHGRLSRSGRMTSSPRQIDQIVRTMADQHAAWAAVSAAAGAGSPEAFRRRVVLYAHGGLVDEMGGLCTAERLRNWWLRNQVYPVSFAWESGPVETILGAMKDLFTGRLPFGGILADAEERWDRFVEGRARPLVSPLWEVMKASAREASDPLGDADVDFLAPWSPEPGASLFVERLARYIAETSDKVEVHLVGHSAGAVFLAALLDRLVERGIVVDSLQLLGGAVTSEEFASRIVPHLGTGLLRFTAFDLTEQCEEDDKCPGGPVTLYFKSLLYFVARALEKLPNPQSLDTPMVGMQKAMAERMSATDARPLQSVIGTDGLVLSPTATGADQPEPDGRAQAKGHGDLDNDRETLTSVLLRILRSKQLTADREYAAYAPWPPNIVGAAETLAAAHVASVIAPGQSGDGGAAAQAAAAAVEAAAIAPAAAVEAAAAAQDATGAQTAATAAQAAAAPQAGAAARLPELGETEVLVLGAAAASPSPAAPRASAGTAAGTEYLDLLEQDGWRMADTATGEHGPAVAEPSMT